jgi:lipopolysaccharide assembly outer membrane protein LptD (OstA)
LNLGHYFLKRWNFGVRAEKRIDKELLNDFRQVGGKTNLLFRLAEAAIEYPEGIIKQVLYPVVGEQTLKDLVKEYKFTGLAYRQRVHTVMRSSYASHYRRMVPQILEVLEFRSSNTEH